MDLNVSVNTTQAQRNVQQLENRVEKLNQAFAGMRNAIAGLAFGALITKAVQLADSLQDVSDATGIASDRVLAFATAVQASGGTFESATNGLNTFVKSINDAASGSKNTREAFKELGIGLSDIETLSEQALLAKTLKGLEQIEDKAKAAAIGTELFGKAFKGVAGQNVASTYTQAVVEAQKYSQSIKSVAELQGKLERTFVSLQLSILKAVQPLADYISSIPQDKLNKIVEGFVNLGGVAVSVAAAAKAIQYLTLGITALGTAYLSFKAGAALFGDGLKVVAVGSLGAVKALGILGDTAKITFNVISKYSIPAFLAAGGLTSKLAELAKTGVMLGTRLGWVGTAFATLGKAMSTMAAGLGLSAAGILRMIPLVGQLAAAGLILNEVLKATTNISLAGWFDEGAAALERFVTEKFPKVAEALNWLGEKMGMAPSPMQQKTSDPRAELRKQEIKDYDSINSLLAARADEEERAAKARKTKADADATAMAQFVMQQRQYLNDLQYGLRLDVSRLAFERDMIVNNGELLRLTDDQIEVNRALFQIVQQRESAVRSLKNQIDQIKVAGNDDANAQAKILLLQQQIKEVNKSYYDQTTKVRGALRSLQDAQYTVKVIEEDRLRTLENITKAYDDQAQRTQTLGDTIKTVGQQLSDAMFERQQIGKSPIEQQIDKIKRDAELAAQSAKQQFASMFGEGDLGPDRERELLTGLDSIQKKYQDLAKAQADNVRANYEYSRSWAGGWNEAFREYMDNATNAANTARDVFGAVTNNMNSAIDNFVNTGKFKFSDFAESIIQDLIRIELKATASKVLSPILSGIGTGISKLLGFADGGNPPVNRPSIVGERGPEVFIPKTSGTIVPNHQLGGQAQVTNNYITNNIQAVDAKSVAQLFAENRRTLFGTMKLAEKELSYR